MSQFQPQVKGAIAVGSAVGAAGSVTPLLVGADGTVLTADSTTPTGLKYAAVSGLQGPQGFQGPQGDQGPQGLQGPQGNQGFEGVQGPQDNQGPQAAQNADIGVSVTDAAFQSIPNAVFTTLTFDTEDWDTSGFHDNAVNNDRLTVPVGLAGKYLVTLNVTFDSNSTGVRISVIRKNGAGIYITDSRNGSGGGIGTSVSISGFVSLAVGDFITGAVYHQDTGGSLAVQSSRRLQMQKVG